jgi:hypothetical protein
MIGAKARLIGGREVEVPMAVKLRLQAEVELAYQKTSAFAKSRLDNIEMEADKGTQVLYIIEWEEQRFSSNLSYMMGGNAYEVPYTYIVHVPKVIGSEDETEKVCPTGASVGQPLSVSSIHLEAEHYDRESSHVGIVECSEGGRLLGWIDNGEWVRFENVDFGSGGLSTFKARVASAESGGQIEIRLDDPNGKLIGVCQVYGTGGWQNWETISCDLTSGVSGKRTVYLAFKGGDTYLFNINWIEFVP